MMMMMMVLRSIMPGRNLPTKVGAGVTSQMPKTTLPQIPKLAQRRTSLSS